MQHLLVSSYYFLLVHCRKFFPMSKLLCIQWILRLRSLDKFSADIQLELWLNCDYCKTVGSFSGRAHFQELHIFIAPYFVTCNSTRGCIVSCVIFLRVCTRHQLLLVIFHFLFTYWVHTHCGQDVELVICSWYWLPLPGSKIYYPVPSPHNEYCHDGIKFCHFLACICICSSVSDSICKHWWWSD